MGSRLDYVDGILPDGGDVFPLQFREGPKHFLFGHPTEGQRPVNVPEVDLRPTDAGL
jgi:hypothetical protein